ncbi:MAG: UvrB/UvrC motif-containing protein [Planctomycetota bacterium]|nr:UvrB/UvrC motif-containing protein [Planctomycetota bacterium]
MRRDIDEALHGWPYEPQTGEIAAREVRARDGRTVIQIRVELGILQMESVGRPDGVRPHGFATYLDYLRHRAADRGLVPAAKAPSWTMESAQRLEADREFVQYYQRRVAWLTLQQYDKALLDAEHTLALMDFVKRHGGDEDYIQSHEKFRGLVLFHRTQAGAAMALERRKPDEAIDAVRDGVERIKAHRRAVLDEDAEDEDAGDDTLVEQLHILEREIRKNFSVGKTLREQLDEAVEDEDYERAAQLRDLIRARTPR